MAYIRTCSGYVSIIKDDVNFVQTRGSPVSDRFREPCGEQGAEKSLAKKKSLNPIMSI